MKLKIAVGVSILCFFIIATATLASYFVIKERNENNPDLPSQVQSENTTPAPSSEPSGLTTAKIAEHSSPTDCWIVISAKVYSITKYLDLHPGGGFTITPYCGKDATNAFNTRDRNPPQSHSNLAHEILGQYLVGSVGVNLVVNSQVPSTKPVTQATPLRTSAPSGQANPPLQASSVSLSTAEVSTHSTSSNCWLIISNNVYNVTNYLVAHPGGISAITPYCGKESTQAFQTRGGRGSNHSSSAYSQLGSYLIGSIGSTIQNSTTQIISPTPLVPPQREDDD